MLHNNDLRKIAVVGAGAWGVALAKLYNASRDVILLSNDKTKNSETLTVCYDLDEILDRDIIMLAIPAQTIREFCLSLVGKIKSSSIIIICSKGIEENSYKLMSEVVSTILPSQPLAVLSGPNFASEIAEGLPAVSSLACADFALANDLADALSVPNFKLYPSADLIGLQIYGALKNVLAILCGIASGLELGENFKAALLTSGVKEISNLVQKKGGKLSSLIEPGGIGDLFLTCNSAQSRNTTLGHDIARIGHFDASLVKRNVEGVYTVKALHGLAKELDLQLPMLEFVYKVIHEQGVVNKLAITEIVL